MTLSSPPVAGVWRAHTLDCLYDSLLSTCSWCVVSALAPLSCGSRRIIQVDAAHWWFVRREHKPKTRSDCQCPRPFKLHKMPSDDESRRQWLAALNLKFPPRNVNVCSFHFVDRQPTTENPHPEILLGYDRPLRKKRRRRRPCQDEGGTIHSYLHG